MTQPNWGVDLATVDDGHGNVDLTPGMIHATGRALLAQSLIRRQTTPRGSVIDCPNDCFDVRDWLSDGLNGSRMQQLQNQIVQELRKDQRVSDVKVKVTYNTQTKALTIVESVQSSEGPFTLTFGLTAANVTVLVSDITQVT